MMIRLRKSSGITMMEMMIVVVVIGILAAMAAPQMDGAIKQIRFNNAGRELLSSYRLARSSAITLQEPFGVNFDSESGVVTVFRDDVNPTLKVYEVGDSVVSSDSVSISFDYMYTSFPAQTVIFNPDGSASSSGDIFCYREENGDYNSFSLYLTAATGRVKLEVYHY